MPSIIDELAQSIRQRRAILFVGAGPSISIGLPSWQTLIDHVADELGVDRELATGPGGGYPVLAEYYRLKQGSIGPLRSWMDRHWYVSREKVAASRLHHLIVELDFPIIYTTNYDRNLEVAYEIHKKEFLKVVNARDITKIGGEATQIIKFHGDFDDDTSLVLAETDYYNRLSFDSPLDMKFRADALGRPILFIGYSMSDMNIRLLLHQLWKTWERSGYEQDRPGSFVFMWPFNPVQEAVLNRWGIRVLSDDAKDPEAALVSFLERLKQSIDVHPEDAVPIRGRRASARAGNGRANPHS
jgi:hypothetical protein